MSRNDFADPIVSQWNWIGEDKVSKSISNEPHVVTDSRFALIGLPDIQSRVQIDGYVEIDFRDEITLPQQFKVDYQNGYVFMHSSKEGNNIMVKSYKSRGVNYYPANRVWTKLTSTGDIDETLEDITNKLDSALDLSNQIQSAENVRISSENQRIVDESTRKSNEVTRKSSEEMRISNESTRVSDEDVRKANELMRRSKEDGRALSEIQRETNEDVRVQNELDRIGNESARESSEQTRAGDELIRQLQEQERQANTTNALANINDTNTKFKVWEDYNNLKEYVPMNKVQYQGSSYVNVIACKGILPNDTNNWQLVAAKGMDGDNLEGVMLKVDYDSNGNGVVDMSEDSQKLGGKLAVDYASKTYVDDQVGLITETGIPKYMEYEYKVIGTIGQSKFDISLETFDSNTDSVDLYINTTYWDRSKYVITNKVGDTLGFITLNAPLEEDKNIVIKVKKNIPMGAEGSTSGSIIADGSIEDRKLTDKTVDDTVVPPIDTNTAKLGVVLNWFGNIFKNITGKTSWKEKPTKNLEELNNDLSSHKAESVTSKEVHGLKIESGIWTPRFGGDSVVGTTIYTNQAGIYYRIGNLVYINVDLRMTSATGGSTYFAISGLPYISNLSSYKFYTNVSQNLDVNIGNIADVYAGKIYFRTLNGTGAIAYSSFDTQRDISLSGIYRIS